MDRESRASSFHRESGGESQSKNVECTSLLNAIIECARLLCNKGADADLATQDGWTALMSACEDGHLDIATLLCERGASPNLQLPDGATSLYIVCLHNHLECARLLCDRGADSLLSVSGMTPFNNACAMFGSHSPMALLLQNCPHCLTEYSIYSNVFNFVYSLILFSGKGPAGRPGPCRLQA